MVYLVLDPKKCLKTSLYYLMPLSDTDMQNNI